MSSTNKIKDHDNGSKILSQKLMVHGFVCPESSCNLSVEIRRGMPILSSEGLEVGKVAAVLLDNETKKATYVLLGRLPEMRGYWLVPVDSISEVGEGNIQLNITVDVVYELPLWQSSD